MFSNNSLLIKRLKRRVFVECKMLWVNLFVIGKLALYRSVSVYIDIW